MKGKIRTGFLMYCAGILCALGGITLLKFQKPMSFPFILCLLLMHTGVLLFIFSKKSFKKEHTNANKYYSNFYFLLLLYVPVLLYKFVLCRLFPSIALSSNEFMVLILTLTATCLILSVRDAIDFAKKASAGALAMTEEEIAAYEASVAEKAAKKAAKKAAAEERKSNRK